MSPRLARTVWVTLPGETRRVRLPAGSNPPEWAWPLITNSAAWAVKPDSEAPVEVSAEGPNGPPPMHGKGSSRDAWAAYAEAHGVHVAPSSSRSDIVAVLDQAKIRTK